MNMRWMALLVAVTASAEAFDLNPACHEHYEMIQQPGLTYEDVGKIAEAMYRDQCWPAMQGQPQPETGDLPSCELLAQSLEVNDQVRKLYQVRPLVKDTDCGIIAEDMSHVASYLTYDDIRLSVAECNLLVDDPHRLAEQRPDLGLRPVNCRGRVVYSNGSRAVLYFFMEQYPDGDRSVAGFEVERWR